VIEELSEQFERRLGAVDLARRHVDVVARPPYSPGGAGGMLTSSMNMMAFLFTGGP